MKRKMIVLFFLVIIVSAFYYIAFVKREKVNNDKFLKISNQKERVIIETMESAKYICGYDFKFVNDSTVNINVYTTSIYNLFARKTARIDITFENAIKRLIIGGKEIERESLPILQ